MAFAAASSNAGTHRPVNEDACCIEAAQTDLGEVLMAIVCDGVGGLSRGNVASSTVIDRFARWFEGELPLLMEGMVDAGRFDFALVEAIWSALLQNLNDLIRTHGTKTGGKLGTTFTGIIACGDHYLVGHVGDCRAYQMSPTSFAQITQDQTLVAKRLAAGEITEEEARRQPKNVILQSVGTERVLRPVFSQGSLTADDLFVLCCDGAYHRAENEGIRRIFQSLDYRDADALQRACDTLLQVDMDYGEKDNLTVACFSGALAAAGEEVASAATRPAAATPPVEDDLPTMVDAGEVEDELPTMVEEDADVASEDDLPTMVEDEPALEAEDDLPTMVGADVDEDDAPTMIVDDENAALAFELPDLDHEDETPTMVADEEPSVSLLDLLGASLPSFGDEDDFDDFDDEEDDLATMVADDEPEADDPLAALRAAAAALLSADDEDDAPTMVADEDNQDDLPTMVDGGDA